jgi:hypothetical protein
MLSIGRRFEFLFGKQSLLRQQGFLAAIVFTGVLLASAMLIFSAKPAVTAAAAKVDIKKRGACKAIPKTLFYRNNGRNLFENNLIISLNNSQGIAPPPAPVRSSDWPKVRRNPLDFRFSPFAFPFLKVDGEDDPPCPGDSCAASCGGTLYCPDPDSFMQAISGCVMRCCWCKNPGSCSATASCDPNEG